MYKNNRIDYTLEEKILPIASSKSHNGLISVIPFISGKQVTTGGVYFNKQSDARECARWENAVDNLRSKGLVVMENSSISRFAFSSNTVYYRLNYQGYQEADKIDESIFNKDDYEEYAPRAKLVTDEDVIKSFGGVEKTFAVINTAVINTKEQQDDSMIENDSLCVFVSYSWDSNEHRERVKKLVSKLRVDGLHVIYDDMELGDRITHFMQNSVAKCDKVLFICTPNYKQKADNNKGGVGYENTIITGELYYNQNERKFIPILFSGTWEQSLPIWAVGKLGADLSLSSAEEENYNKLLQNLKNIT